MHQESQVVSSFLQFASSGAQVNFPCQRSNSSGKAIGDDGWLNEFNQSTKVTLLGFVRFAAAERRGVTKLTRIRPCSQRTQVEKAKLQFTSQFRSWTRHYVWCQRVTPSPLTSTQIQRSASYRGLRHTEGPIFTVVCLDMRKAAVLRALVLLRPLVSRSSASYSPSANASASLS